MPDPAELEATNLALAQRNHALQLLADLALNIRQSRQIDSILQQTSESIQIFLQVARVLVLEITPEGCIARAESVLPEQPQVIGEQFLDPCFATDYINRFQDGTPSMIVDVSQAKIQDCHRELLDRLEVKANLVAPIILQDEIWGLLVAHQCNGPRRWTTLEAELLKQVADQISVGLSQWQFLNQLEILVQERTTALLKSQREFRSLFEAAPDLIYILDTEGKIQKVNPSVLHYLGFEEAELIGKPILMLLTPEFQATFQQNFLTVLEEGFHRQEMKLITKNGSLITVDCSCKIFNGDDTSHILVLQRDISERKAVEAMKDEFVSVVSHELRTPLTSIHGALKLLETGNLGNFSDQGYKVINIAIRNTERLTRLINDVLDLERIESGNIAMHRQHCSVSGLMTHAAQEMQAMATERNITIITHPLDGTIHVDSDHIVQTLTNLLSNAIKFSPTHSTISINAIEQEQDIQFEVQDEGRGIPEDKLEKIFERFQQLDASDSRTKDGTGLGLAICRQIIERYGGKIWAESIEEKGSCFYFTLPKSPI